MKKIEIIPFTFVLVLLISMNTLAQDDNLITNWEFDLLGGVDDAEIPVIPERGGPDMGRRDGARAPFGDDPVPVGGGIGDAVLDKVPGNRGRGCQGKSENESEREQQYSKRP